MSEELDALRKIPTDFAATPDDIWDDVTRPDVKGINDSAYEAVLDRIEAATSSNRASVLGLPIVGRGGTGKTHLLGVSRKEVQRSGGYFVHLRILRIDDFWTNLVSSYLEALNRPHQLGASGLEVMLNSLADRSGLDPETCDELLSHRQPTPKTINSFLSAMKTLDAETTASTRHTLRALLLLFSHDLDHSDIGDNYLRGGTFDPDGIFSSHQPPSKSAKERAQELSSLIALSGPTLIALDQIDDIVGTSQRAFSSPVEESNANQLLELLGNGLTDLRDLTRRSAVILSCLPHVWDEFRTLVTDTVRQRFDNAVNLDVALPDPDTAARLLAAVVGPAYQKTGFAPPYPSYPFPVSSLQGASRFTPRELLNSAREHIRACIAEGRAAEATTLTSAPAEPPVARENPKALAELDARLEKYRSEADIGPALNQHHEDAVIPDLLCSALESWIIENQVKGCTVRGAAGARSSSHAEMLNKPTDGGQAERWSFRAVASVNGRAVGNRVDKLYDISGFGQDNPIHRGHGILWVTAPPSKWRQWTPRSQVHEIVAKFEAEGMVIAADHGDLRTFTALDRLKSECPHGWEEWLQSRRPASSSVLLAAVFGSPTDTTSGEPTEPQPDPELNSPCEKSTQVDIPPQRAAPSQQPEPNANGVFLGEPKDGAAVTVDLADFAKHTVVFAGSGSGKTVLLKRIIEACAMQGVSSIVLDPNNDLSRLGQAWPEQPDNWFTGDPEAAKRYFADTEVVVWTPGRSAGRPLSFQPLPDLRSVIDSPDDFEIALDTVVSSLAPRARIDGATAKAELRRAILREALQSFVSTGGLHFDGFLDYLSHLPPEVSSFDEAPKKAADIAATLKAVRVNDRMFAGDSENLDPSALLTPKPGKKARVSVVNFMGLPSDEQRQSFVNQLEMTLFSWLKENPAAGRPLGGLLVIDEAQTFAPSTGSTPCTESTLALVSQARKYGLGMVFATQAPKGIHNRIVGNSATHFYGRLNSPIQIAAANAIAQNKGGVPIDVARLSTGQFYVVTAGRTTEPIDTPMCLSHHPPTAPTSEEILAAVRSETEPED